MKTHIYAGEPDHVEPPRLIPRPRHRLNQAWLDDRETRRKAIWSELTQPAMGHGALEALREERVKREIERRIVYWLHKKGLSADPATMSVERARDRKRRIG